MIESKNENKLETHIPYVIMSTCMHVVNVVY